jgi:hypothetical protein
MTKTPRSTYNGDGTKAAQAEYAQAQATKTKSPEPDTPMTETVLNIPEMIPQDHQWIQQGRHILDIDDQCPKAAVEIPTGMTLIKDEKGYRLVADAQAVAMNTRK